MAKKKINELVADIPLRSTTKVYYVRMENGMPGDQGWVTVDEAKRMNAADRRTHGQPQNRYFQDQQSGESFAANPPGGAPGSEMPPAEAPMPEEPPVGEEPVDDFGAGLEPDMGMEPPIGEEPVDDFGDGLDGVDMGDEMMPPEDLGEPDMMGDLGDEGDMLGDLTAEEEADFELVVPRRVRLVPAKESLGEADMRGFASKAGTTPDEVDKKELAMGIKVEMEHTADKDVATKIALDHLTEIPDYYTRLAKLEKDAKADGKFTEVESLGEAEGMGELAPEQERAIIHFVKTHANLDDSDFHAFVEQMGVDPHEAEEVVYRYLHQNESESFEDYMEKRFKLGKRAKKAAGKSYSKTKNPDAYYGTATKIQKAINAKESEEPESQEEAACKHCGAAVTDNICTSCKRIQGEQPKADYRDRPHNGVKKHMKPRKPESQQTEQFDFAGEPFDPNQVQSFPSPVSKRRRKFTRKTHARPKARQSRLADPAAGSTRSTQPPANPMMRGGMWSPRAESQSTEEGIIEALLSGDCTIEEAITEQTMGTAGQVTYSPRDQGILGRQVQAHTQVQQPKIQWGQQQQGPQLPPELQQLYAQYMQAVQNNDPSAPQLKQQLTFELQVAGIDPQTVIR